MTRLSYDQLNDLLKTCQRENAILAQDEEWTGQEGVITRKAVPLYVPRVAESVRYVVAIVFETSALRDIKGIRRVLSARSANVLLRARWSVTHALILLAAEPVEYCQMLAPILKNEHLEASLYFVSYSGNVGYDHDRAIGVAPIHWIGKRSQP